MTTAERKDLARWMQEMWQVDDMFGVVGCTNDRSDEWPLKAIVPLRTAHLEPAADQMPDERSWYCVYGQSERQLQGPPRREDIPGGQCLFVDVDDYKGTSFDLPLTPSFVIQTSEKGFHHGWLLDTWQTAQVVEDYSRSMQEATGTDAVFNVNRWMRLPWGFNYKTEHGDPFPVRLVEATYHRYSIQDLHGAGIERKSSPKDIITLEGPECVVGERLDADEIMAKYRVTRRMPKLYELLTRHRSPRWLTEMQAVGQMVRAGMSFNEVYWLWYTSVNNKWLEDVEYRGAPEYHMRVSLTHAYQKAWMDMDSAKHTTIKIKGH